MMADEIRGQSAVFSLSGVRVVEIDAQTGHPGRVNAAFCELLAYSEAELRELSYTGLSYTPMSADASRYWA